MPFSCLLPALVSSGCYDMSITTLAAPGADSKKAYIIVPADSTVSPADLQFSEYANELVCALDDKRYRQAETPEKADVVIYMAYAISAPQEHTLVSSATDYGFSNSTTNVAGTVGMKPVTGSATTQTYGPVGTHLQTRTVTSYRRVLIISAADADKVRAKDPSPEIWRDVVTSEGTNGDLRVIMPAMIYAASSLFAQNSHQAVALRVKANDANVKYIMTGDRKK